MSVIQDDHQQILKLLSKYSIHILNPYVTRCGTDCLLIGYNQEISYDSFSDYIIHAIYDVTKKNTTIVKDNNWENFDSIFSDNVVVSTTNVTIDKTVEHVFSEVPYNAKVTDFDRPCNVIGNPTWLTTNHTTRDYISDKCYIEVEKELIRAKIERRPTREIYNFNLNN